MTLLAGDPRTVFLGQAVRFKGTAMTGTLEGIPEDRKIEMPVCEDMQMGVTTGLALQGHIPVSLFPRWNFLLLATNQLVNHLDKLPLLSAYRPRAIIRTGIGSERPLYPGPQHVGDFTEAFQSMCETVRFERLEGPEQIVPAYRAALERKGVTVLVEYGDYHNEK